MSWQSQAIDELNKLTGQHAQKKRNTVIALADARISGRSEETVWKMPDTCSRMVYHAKWKKDPTFAEVLDAVTAMARGWKDGESLRSLEEAARRLALASPVAVTKAIEKLQSIDEAVVLRAAFGILDRAGVETATKQSQEIGGNVNVNVKDLSDDELRAIIDNSSGDS